MGLFPATVAAPVRARSEAEWEYEESRERSVRRVAEAQQRQINALQDTVERQSQGLGEQACLLAELRRELAELRQQIAAAA